MPINRISDTNYIDRQTTVSVNTQSVDDSFDNSSENDSSSSSGFSVSGFTSIISGSNGAKDQADDETKKLDNASDSAQVAVGQVKSETRTFQEKTKSAISTIGNSDKTINIFVQKSEKANQDTQTLAAELDTLASDSTDDSSGANPFGDSNDGTGSGVGSAFSLQVGGPRIMAQPRPGGDPTDSENPGAGTDAASGNSDKNAPSTQPTGNAENTEKQSKVDDLNAKIQARSDEQNQSSQSAQDSVKSIRNAYSVQLSDLKKDALVLDKKSSDADNKITDAQDSQKRAAKVLSIGSKTTTAGKAAEVASNFPNLGWMRPWSYRMQAGGGAATVAGGGMTIAANSSLKSAQQQKSDTTKAKANLKAQSGLLAQSYTKSLAKAKKS